MSTSDYAVRAQAHAPRTFEELQAAAQQLIDDGHSDYGAAAALGLAVEQVRRLIGQCASGNCE